MVRPRRAVLFMEEAVSPESGKPLMLEAVLERPILSWMGAQLLAEGVGRFFVVCGPRFSSDAKACFPAEAEVIVSEARGELEAFLSTTDMVLVLNRSAIPMAQAGPGFAYAAPGCELRKAWRERLTNAVQAAELVGGWLPVYGPSTIAELEMLLRGRETPSTN